MNILAIESSCDETAAALVRDGRTVLASTILSQVEEHKLYGGVVPEIASRRHIENISGVVAETLSKGNLALHQLDGIAVTAAPGLIGALLVGVNFAKGLAYSAGLPLVPVHHIRGHLAANYLVYPALTPPFIGLVVSGGHSHIVRVTDYTDYQILGRTLDDAAGEAFDKVARTLGYPYPGGVSIDKAAQNGDPSRYKLPTPKAAGAYNFSFSGLKTAVINLSHNLAQKGESLVPQDLAASFQEKVVEILVGKLLLAAKDTGEKTLVIGGGVAANSGLRAALEAASNREGLRLFLPPLSLCGDNAAMIGSQGYYEYLAGYRAPLSLNAYAAMEIEGNFPQ